MILKQLSIFLENTPGALSAPCRALANAGINIQTFALADTQQFGILRLVVQEWERAHRLLIEGGWTVKVTDVVAIQVPDRPGGLADIFEILERASINVEYMYAFTAKQEGQGLMLFRFDAPDLAVKALQAAKVSILGTVELFKSLGA